MKKTAIIALAASAFIVAACSSPAPAVSDSAAEARAAGLENPNRGPEISVEIPELFSLDPDVEDDTFKVLIAINHPVPVRDWQIEVRRQFGGGEGSQIRGGGAGGPERAERPEGGGGRGGAGGGRRAAFFEQSGEGSPPEIWEWNGRNTGGDAMVMSATDYRFTISINDVFDNSNTFEGTISTDVMVRREGDNYRIIVPAIVFPGNSADFNLLSEEDRRSNARIISLIGRALNRFDGYRVTVEGHANPTTPPGTAARNAEEAGGPGSIGLRPLSEARANAVVNHLVEHNNVQRARLTVVGIGGARTVAPFNDPEENWQNRRVEFLLQR
jgi:outer membrane protein OmpA-like peptidoglycan-associated protein